ncbi:PREDICTED: uncharacterized protein LOC103331291 [Prunus mume]|uniref:Uncharacterized protein LOC103331291 n=1 Tax=Prunus mume TaxID=102107 RepID=A0ABM0NZE0_PRUMU|nr:PREDICTED: uncharacterized protein LOC103331291 [Prunus mume]
MDGFSGYNQIKMSPKDVEKTTFRMPYENFYYTVMLFRLKNAGATYQKAMTAVFHDMMGKEVEDYVDDLVVKSKTRESHQEVLRRVLERCRLYGLKMNPKKCAFGVSSGLAATMSVFTPLLKKGKPYKWSKECQEAYQQVQQIITKLPTMRAPILGLLLKLYLAATNTVRLQHYFIAHKLHLIVKSDRVRYLLTRPVLSGSLARWSLQLFEFDITCTTPKAIKGQAVIDMLAVFPEVEESMLSKEVPEELSEIVAIVTKEGPWTVYFDGSSTSKGGGAGVTNRYADALATLGSKLSFVEEQPNIAVIKKDMLVIEAMAQEDDWRKSVKEKMGKGSDIKELKDYGIILEELYKRLPGGILTRCIGTIEARVKLQKVHEVTYNLELIISLYRRLQHKGYYWPEMRKQAAEMQANCPKCATIPSIEESFTISFAEDWRAPYLASFINGVLPTKPKHARKLKKTMKRYFMDGSTLYRKGFNGKPLKCLGELEAQEVMQEIHAGECGKHQGMKRLYQQLLSVWFGMPYKIVTDNGTPFVNKQYEGGWSVHLSDALWAYCTSPRSAIGFSPYSLVYRSNAISPIEITISTTRVSAVNDLEWDTMSCSGWRLLDLEALDEKRAEAERRTALYHRTVAQAYNRIVKPRAFK